MNLLYIKKMNKKTELRLSAKELRKSLDIGKISASAVKSVRENNLYINSNHIMLFYPTKYEINLLELLNDEKKFYLPRVNSNDLEVCPYKKDDMLKISELHIEEPQTQPIDANIIELVIVPALMADKNNYRLGYGGGYYDRFLYGKNFNTICTLPKELYVDNLPHENYDIQIDEIIVV